MHPFADRGMSAPRPYRVVAVPGDGGCAVHAAATAATLIGVPTTAESLYDAYHEAVDSNLPGTFDEYKRCWTTVPVADASADTWFMARVPKMVPTPVTTPYSGGLPDHIDAETLLPHYPWPPRVVFINRGGHYWAAVRGA